MINDKAVKMLTENKEKFQFYVKKFYNKKLFTGPSIYFHRKVIESIRQSSNFNKLINTDQFLEDIYATLVSWGMHRMGQKGAKMKRFIEFKNSIVENKSLITRLSKFKLHTLNENEKESVKKDLLVIFSRLTIMESKAKLVGNSKVLHHLLPDLVPPIDRQYTLKFFYGNKNFLKCNEEKIFSEIFDMYWLICKKLRLTDKDFLNGQEFTTSIPKLIDNAIVGYL